MKDVCEAIRKELDRVLQIMVKLLVSSSSHMWHGITGSYDGARPATGDVLRDALSGEVMGGLGMCKLE